jgi:hypothetical protein
MKTLKLCLIYRKNTEGGKKMNVVQYFKLIKINNVQ